MHFNPLSLYRERRADSFAEDEAKKFQSTLPIQGETYGEKGNRRRGKISIHSPYTGRDGCFYGTLEEFRKFQSTLPIQGETAILHIKPLIYSQSLMQNAKQKNFFQHLHNKL